MLRHQARIAYALIVLLGLVLWFSRDWDSTISRSSLLLSSSDVHPIAQLSARAETQWHELLNKQSKTLGQAYKEYKRRYGRNPPKGFDKWYQWSTERGLKLVDAIHNNLLPFWGLTPVQIESRRQEMVKMANKDRFFTIHIKNGVLSDDPEDLASTAKWPINRGYYDIFEEIAVFLPDMSITINLHDLPLVHVPKEERDRLIQLGKTGQFVSDEEHEKYAAKYAAIPADFGWKDYRMVCPPSSPIYTSVETNAFGEFVLGPKWEKEQLDFRLPEHEGGFIWDHHKAMDPCYNPELKWQHGNFITTSGENIRYRKHYLYPLFSWTSYPHSDDILIPTSYRFEKNRPDSRVWNKMERKIGWRGILSGIWALDDADVWASQRYRLASLVQDDFRSIKVLANGTNNRLAMTETINGPMNERFLDIGFAGGVQSLNPKEDSAFATKAKAIINMAEFTHGWVEKSMSRILLDIDGWGWSARFRQLLWTGGAVLKSTAFKEVTTDWLVPWYHYIPMDYAYRDLYSIALYYLGLGTRRQNAHDAELKRIAQQGQQWVDDHATWNHHLAYSYRLGLEWARVLSDDRSAMDWVPVAGEV